jgi:hypothetical protein
MRTNIQNIAMGNLMFTIKDRELTKHMKRIVEVC